MQTTPLTVACTSCSTRYRVAAGSAGKRMKCKHCGEIFAIPSLDESEHVPPVAPADRREQSRPAHSSKGSKLSVHSTSSIRARHEEKHERFHITPMHIIFTVATVLVAMAYLKWCK